MQRTARQNVQHPDEPSIIVDPILYACATPCLLQRVCESFIGFTRVVVIVCLAATTGFATAQVVRTRSLGQATYGAVGDGALAVAREASRDSVHALGCIAEPVLAKIYGRAERATICSVSANHSAATAQPVHTVARDSELTTVAAPPQVAAPAPSVSVPAGQPQVPHLAPLPIANSSSAAPALAAEQLVARVRQELARGRFDEALRIAQRAVDAAPHRASVHVALGDVLRLRGDIKAAQVQYEFAKRLQPQQALRADRVLPANPF